MQTTNPSNTPLLVDMPVDDSFAFLGAGPAERKSIKKPHWKDKLFSRDKNNHRSADQQVEAFLGPSRSKTDLSHPDAAPKAFPTANLDASHQQWPSSQDVSSVSPVSDPSSPDNYLPSSDAPRPRKTRVRKGLKVGFTERVPEIIGEGGDEAETPAIEVSIRRSRRRARGATAPKDASAPEHVPSSRPPQLRVQTSVEDMPRRSDQSRGMREGPNVPDWRPPLMHNAQEAELLMSLNLEDKGSRLSFRSSPESSTFAQQVRAKMQAEEGRALQHRYEDLPSPSSPPSPPDDEPQPHLPNVSPGSPDSMYETTASDTDNASPYTAFRPQPSPVGRAPTNLSPVDPSLPTGLTPGGHASRFSPPKPSPIAPELPSDRQSPSTRGSGDRSPQPPKASLRSIANQVGDSAFADFKTYVTRYASLIRLSAESVKPLMETSLAEWMRASIWWFLRGRKRLETYARSRSRGAGSVQRTPSGSAKQAVIDLGKAFWINENIVPHHEELTRYGDMGVEALLAVVSTTGDKQMVDILSLHQAVSNHIRSLTMSIKRNNILDTLELDDGSGDQVDTGVWIRYPFFAPDVSAILSGAATRSMVMDKASKASTITHMMPLGDSARYFAYGSMFVQVRVSSSEDDVQQFAMPCVLSVIRERADWYVYAAITSQSELVNVMIQPDRKQGPTWDDVDWHVRSQSMRVKLPRGFELDVMFQEDDFRMIWNIVKYTNKAEASLSPEDGESVAFETTLKVFHYMDPGTPKAFPSEPLERCRIRLFERSVTVTEGTGTRSLHQGFRLTVLTSPKVKTLSNVRHILGYGAPIVFGLLRGEDGAPALMLKVNEEGRTRSMLLTFYELPERTKMHSLLLAMRPGDREFRTPELGMRSYAIEQPADKVSGRSALAHLQFPAGNVSVIDQEHDYVDHGYGPTVLSEHLRVFVATEWGSVTDRINLGMSISGCPDVANSCRAGRIEIGFGCQQIDGIESVPAGTAGSDGFGG